MTTYQETIRARVVPRIIELIEYEGVHLPLSDLKHEDGVLLWRQFASQISVGFPTPRTHHQWHLTSQGWVGYLPLTQRLHFRLQPRVPVVHLLDMLSYAYNLNRLRVLDGVMPTRAIEDIFEQLAQLLAQRILDRLQKGLYRTYLRQTVKRAQVRGRLEIGTLIKRPWQIPPPSTASVFTADVADNQLLVWTLNKILDTGIGLPETRGRVHLAQKRLRDHGVRLVPFEAIDCVGRVYTRLNADYRALHQLCRFFLDHTGPGMADGAWSMMPFMIHMPYLFEQFVVNWLERHLPDAWMIRYQNRVDIGQRTAFYVDGVIYQRRDLGYWPRIVVDTKYRPVNRPSASDLAQVVAYAVALGCAEAILVYPAPLEEDFDVHIGPVRVRAMAFPLQGDLDVNGQYLLNKILGEG